jgi:putative FmdB family regulatory protein
MPTYSYRCTSCKHELEAFQKITDEPLVICPKCEKHSLERGFGGGQALFQFKGSGFYQTDYKKCKPDGSCCPCEKKTKRELKN